jgi:hypothetical protein
MSNTWKGEQYFESTKCRSKALANKVLGKREGVQRAMRHSSPETKRHYQLGMVEQVRQNLEKANENVYGGGKVLRFYDGQSAAETKEGIAVSK